MVAHLRRAEERLGKSCRILMDLAGPKVRTGELQPGPAVLNCRPKRDSHGRVVEPARVWLFAEDQRRPSPTPADASLPVPGAWLRRLARDDRIQFVDARGASRVLRTSQPRLKGAGPNRTRRATSRPVRDYTSDAATSRLTTGRHSRRRWARCLRARWPSHSPPEMNWSSLARRSRARTRSVTRAVTS
jgi:hypothetical protein